MEPEDLLRLLTLFTFLAVSFLLLTGYMGSSERPGDARAVDGDTFEAGGVTYRLQGVDSPETDGTHPLEFGLEPEAEVRRCLSQFAAKAKQEARELAETGIRVVPAGKQGSYGRELAYVFGRSSSESFNLLLVRRGLGRVYLSGFRRRAAFLEAQRNARQRDIGVWSCG